MTPRRACWQPSSIKSPTACPAGAARRRSSSRRRSGSSTSRTRSGFSSASATIFAASSPVARAGGALVNRRNVADGLRRRAHGIGYGQPLSHPLAQATLAQVHDYPWPDPNWIDVSGVRAEALAWKGQYAILGGDWSPFWHDAIDLLGMENLYLKMYDEPELVEAVLQHIVDFYAAVNRRIFDAAADAMDVFFIGNDFGGQTGPLLSPALFDHFILPHLRRLIDLGHAYNLRVQLHCCGGFRAVDPRDDRRRSGRAARGPAVLRRHGPGEAQGELWPADRFQRRD